MNSKHAKTNSKGYFQQQQKCFIRFERFLIPKIQIKIGCMPNINASNLTAKFSSN